MSEAEKIKQFTNSTEVPNIETSGIPESTPVVEQDSLGEILKKQEMEGRPAGFDSQETKRKYLEEPRSPGKVKPSVNIKEVDPKDGNTWSTAVANKIAGAQPE